MRIIVTTLEGTGTFIVGLLVTRALYIANGWWLDSGREVLRTSLVLAALGAFVAIWRFGRPWLRAAGVWAGALLEMTMLLVLMGPGTIWPIVLVFAGGISAAAVFGGAWTGMTLSKRVM
jgi:hypothetical protein